MKQKGNVVIIILILAALAAVGYFGYKNYWPRVRTLVIASPSPISFPTVLPAPAGWKTFMTDKLQFAINYPQGFEVNQTYDPKSGAILEVRIDKIANQPGGPIDSYISITTNDSSQPSQINYNVLLSMNIGDTKETDTLTQQSFTRLADTTIGNVLAKGYINESPWEFPGKEYLYLVSYNNSVYSIDEGVNTNDSSKEALDQIISTFRFIGKTSLIPADSQAPAASSCNSVQGDVISVTLNPDVPNPRCVIISANQKLTLVNGTSQLISLDYDSYVSKISPGSNYTFPVVASLFLAPGVHVIKTSLYSGSGPEVWLQ
ncbi:MAG: hypothetical protein ABSE04_01915 [Candidatus Microgenomates bacterium]|jgi:hypothetical protein